MYACKILIANSRHISKIKNKLTVIGKTLLIRMLKYLNMSIIICPEAKLVEIRTLKVRGRRN